ncbi:MAG: outer membrane beta-barrel protein [Chryseobacterium sp.]|nr:outer membrane beta-barrel protein [Chryseobacterium sp.]
MNLKLLFSFFAALLLSFFVKAQRHEIGLQLGISNLVGDIGNTSYVLQRPILHDLPNYGIPFYGGLVYRMNFNPYQTLRFNVGYSHIQFKDSYAKENYRRQRKLGGTNSIYEADVLFEYNLFPVNDEQKSLLSPYIFGGLGGMITNVAQAKLEHDFKRDNSGAAIAPSSPNDFVTTQTYLQGQKATMSIPFGVGLKYKFSYNWALFGEFMFRPTFSDGIDYSVLSNKDVKVTYNKDILDPNGKKSLLQSDPYLAVAKQRETDFIKNREIGNINSKDWVNSITLGISYSFGRPPCYCEQ